MYTTYIYTRTYIITPSSCSSFILLLLLLLLLSFCPLLGHYSTVTMTFEQGSDGVQLHVKQTGVPIGEEELTQRNWTGYYWRSIKQTFGFGAVF